MPDFKRYSNYSPRTAFSSVIFGANAPVLEVELNEMQDIMHQKLYLLTEILGEGVFITKNGGIDYDRDTMVLSIHNCIAITEGQFIRVPEASITMSPDKPVAYIAMREAEVAYGDELKEYGYVNGEVIDNPIKDDRLNVETTRRKVVLHSLECAEVLPVEADGKMYIQVGALVEPEEDPENPGIFQPMEFNFTNVVTNFTEMVNTVAGKVTSIEQNPPTSSNPGTRLESEYKDGVLRLYNVLNYTDEDLPEGASGVLATLEQDVSTLKSSVSELENRPTCDGHAMTAEYDADTFKLTLTLADGSGSSSASSIPLATKDTPGLMMVGEGLDVDDEGRVSTTVEAQAEVAAELAAQMISENATSVEDVNDTFRQLGIDPTPDDPSDDDLVNQGV